MASQKLFDQSFFQRLAKFSLSPRIHPISGLSGHYKSGKKGSSIEFSDIREYLPGDDIRRIDWNAYARTEKLFVKLYMEERDVHYHILIDMSRSMDIPKEKSKKACLVAGMLAWLALHGGDRVDITFLRKQGSYTTKTYSGTASFYQLLSELEQAEFSESCHITKQIRSLSFYGNGTVFLISDFLYPFENAEIANKYNDDFSAEMAKRIHTDIKYILCMLQNKKQAVVLIHIVSKEEEHPELLFSDTSSEQLFTLTDSETGKQIKITPSKKLLKSYHTIKTNLECELSSTAVQYRASYIKTISDEPLEKLIEYGLQKGLWKQ